MPRCAVPWLDPIAFIEEVWVYGVLDEPIPPCPQYLCPYEYNDGNFVGA